MSSVRTGGLELHHASASGPYRPDTAVRRRLTIRRRTVVRMRQAAEYMYCVVVIILFSGAFIDLLREGSGTYSPIAGDRVQQLTFLMLYIGAFFFSLFHLRAILTTILHSKVLWLLILIAVASILWSAWPMLTVRRSIALLGTTYVGLYFGVRYSFRRQLEILAVAVAIIVVASLFFGLVLPQMYGIEQSGPNRGAWRGVFLQKNHLGRTVALGLSAFALLAVANRRRTRLLYLTLCGVGFILIVLSDSKSALLVTLAMIGVAVFLAVFRWRAQLSSVVHAFMLLVGSSVGIALLWQLANILDLLGRDLTLSGRTHLWRGMLEMMARRPVGGYGYGAFWVGWDFPSGYVWRQMPTYRWLPLHGHGSFFDLGVELGILGIVLFIITFVLVLLRSFQHIQLEKTAYSLWPGILLIFTMGYAISESIILKRNDIFWVLYVAIYSTFALQSAKLARARFITRSHETT